MSVTWQPIVHEASWAAVDGLLDGLVSHDDARLMWSRGEWLRAYQRVTHYCRALDVWSPPPHLLAWMVLKRAVHSPSRDHGVAPIRLAMEELQTVLQVRWEADAAMLVAPWTGRLNPVPAMLPAPMVPQPLESFGLRRLLVELTQRIRHLSVGALWRRRHA